MVDRTRTIPPHSLSLEFATIDQHQNEFKVVRKALVDRGMSQQEIRDNYRMFYDLMCQTEFYTDEKNVGHIYNQMKK
jgi:hypothetical protein